MDKEEPMAITIRRRMAIANPLSAGSRKRESGDGGSMQNPQSDFVDLGLKIPRPRVPLLKQNAQVPSAPHGAQIPPSSSRLLTSLGDCHPPLLGDCHQHFFSLTSSRAVTTEGRLEVACRAALTISAYVAHTAAPPLCRRAELRDANWTPAVQISYSLRRFTPQMPTAFHQTLLNDPLVITQRKNPTAPRTILDGKLGAILTESPFIITMPNASWIPNPSRTPNEILQIRRDFLYGAEDPLLWPQEDEPSAPYLPCLLRIFPRDGSVDDKLTFLWDSPSQSQHFVEDASFCRGCGHATPGLSRDLEACLSCLEAMFSCISYPPETMQAFHRYTSIMSMLTQMLQLTPSRFHISGGCFCSIPVWLLRDIQMFEQCRVDSLAPIMYAKDILEVSLPTPIVPPLWEGPRRGMGKIKALTSYIEHNQGSFLVLKLDYRLPRLPLVLLYALPVVAHRFHSIRQAV
ncbi:hypothetical protein BDZ89DRAFT_1052966 [Hymenopellis radicata]|nr:hypothetical protein BDZ89DRAFT_1052966 [Hymenopellis radicata]